MLRFVPERNDHLSDTGIPNNVFYLRSVSLSLSFFSRFRLRFQHLLFPVRQDVSLIRDDH